MSDASDSFIRVLGPLEVVSEAGLAHLGGPKQRAVLGMLTVRAGRVVTTDQLVDGIWGDAPPTAVSSSIHSYISTLRTVINWPIERHGSGYMLDVDRARIDANVFEDAFERGRRELVASPSASADELREALALWRGRAYADVADFPGLEDEAHRLTDLRLSAVEVRIDADLALGRHTAVVGELEALAAENPFRESLRAKHMLALYRDGRQAEALRAYRRTQDYLREELGVEPSPELAELEERILNHDFTLIHSNEVSSEKVALLFTDIVDSARLWETNRQAMQAAVARQSHIIQSAIEDGGGTTIRGTGDGFIAAFAEPAQAARAALDAQKAITAGDWRPLEFRVRMSIDTGDVEKRGGDLFGPPMTRGARLLAAAHGGQIVLSNDAQRAVTREAGTQVKSLGEHRFRGLGTPQAVHQLVSDGLPTDFPPLNVGGGSIDLDRTFGDSIRGYELRERIGQGALAMVYRGYQPSIGREVAIKIVKPEFANHPAFIRRFESEARFVAGLEHPHIVSVYDYWRDADGAYIVEPYLAGRSLADGTLAPRPIGVAIKIASQVGSALSYAHRQGVLHRDVRPANILLDSDGNAYLADFGIAARAVEAATGIQSKSFGYRAPEDRDGGAVDGRSDLYGLAAVVAHLLVGTQSEPLDLSALDGRLRDVITSGQAEDPEDRYESVDEFLDHLLAAAGETEVDRTTTTRRNPYKGLAAFTQQDAPDFFGRSDEIPRMVGLVSQNRLSAVIGPSGSGKSSLILAGLAPALAAGAVPGSETWISVRAVPGGYPFDELAIALGALSTEPLSVLATELAAPDGRGLLRVAKRIGQELDGDLLIVIDQFEELFTLVAEDDVRNAYATAIVTAATDPASRVRIVLTLRADFFHQVMTHPSLAPIIGRAHLALANLDAGGIRLAIVEPAARAGLRFEPGLPERIVSDLKDQPGSLPLLQFTLDRLAASATDGLITADDYVELGGVKGALAERAEATFQGLTDSQKQAAQQIFTRLLSVAGGTDDVRRRVRMTEFESLGLATGDLEAVVRDFGRERLLTFDVDPTTRGATVEVAHEALLREWPTLRAWVDSRRESLLLQRRFQVALGEWEESDQNPTNLLTGGRLSQFAEWAAGEDVNLAAAEERFLEASIDRATTEAANRRARRRRITGGFAAAAVVALLLATAAFVQRSQAVENAALAEARRVVLEAEKSLATDAELSTLLALESIEAFRAAGLDPPGSAVAVLREGLRTSAVIKRIPGGRFVAVNGAGTLLATFGDDDVVVRSIAADDVPGTLTRPGASPIGAVFATGNTLAVSYSGVAQPVRIWRDWHQPDSFVDIGPGNVSTRDVESVQWSPDGDLVAIDGREVWSMTSAEKRYTISSNDQGSVAAFSADGRLGVLDSSDERPAVLRVLDAESGAELELINLDVAFQPSWLSYSPEGDRLAVADPFHLAVVDSHSGALAWHNDDLSRVGSPFWVNGKQLLVGGEGIPAVVDAASGNLINKLPGHRGGTESSAQIPGRMQVASAGSEDRETIIFDLGNTPFEVGGFTSSISEIDYMWSTEGGANLLVQDGGNSQAGVIIDAVTGDIEGHFPGTEAVHSSHGRFSAGIDSDGRAVLWSTSDGREVFVAPDGWEVRGVSDDGSLAVIAGPTTGVVGTADGSLVAELDAGSGVHEAIFSPDLRSVVTNNNGVAYPGIRVFDVSSGDLLGSIGWLGGLASMFTPDGSKLVVGGYDGQVNIFDFAKLRAGVDESQAVVRSITAHEAFILSATVSPDGRMLFSRAWDEPVRLWDLETGESLGEFGALDPANKYPPAAAFHPTEPWLYASVGDSQIAIYTLNTDELVEIARSRLTRSLTDEECQLYLQRACREA